jgi:hypothetical protein
MMDLVVSKNYYEVELQLVVAPPCCCPP